MQRGARFLKGGAIHLLRDGDFVGRKRVGSGETRQGKNLGRGEVRSKEGASPGES